MVGLLSDMRRSSERRVAEARERTPEAALRAAIVGTPAPPPLPLAPHGFDVIAELKLRSPLAELKTQPVEILSTAR